MTIQVRNLLTPYTQGARGCNHVIAITEMLRAAGYTYNSDDGDANWANNVLVDEPGGGNGFEVSAANPRQVYDPLGRFTAAMAGTDSDGACITLEGANEENRSCWKITEYIDANNVKVGVWGENPDAWVDETDIPGRVWTQNAGVFGNDSWMLLDAPAPSKLQARVHYDSSSRISLYVRPAGQDGDPTEAGVQDALDNYYTNRVRAQMYADGPDVFICWIDQDGKADVMGWGELEVDDPTADQYPGFVLFHDDTQNTSCVEYEVRMLDHAGANTQAYIDVLKGETMTVKSNTDAAILDLKAELAGMSFLDPGGRDAVDDGLVAEIQAAMDALTSRYRATFRTTWGGTEHTPTARELAHWLFDGADHRLTVAVYPTSTDEVLLWTTDVPILH